MNWSLKLAALALLALAQTGVLAAMVYDRMRLLSSGREITLPVIPVDPRDLFRGEYVRLGYDIGRVPVRLLEGRPPQRGEAFYVTLERKEDGAWQPIKVTRRKPDETGPDRIVLKGRSSLAWSEVGSTGNQFVRYGIESYFVPEGEGRRLEDLARGKKLATVIAVDTDGNAAIKGLVVDGQLQYQEPLF
jgi:uncharacterized membrane-anchored protein